MADKKVSILVELGIKGKNQLGSLIKSVGNLAKAPFKLIGNGFKKISTALFSLKGLIGGAALGAAIKKSNDLWIEQKRVLDQTEAVLKSTGNAAGLTAKEINDMAGKLQLVTNFGDEVTQSGQNILLTFKNLGADVFPRVTETMLDVSQAMGQDVKSSAIQLGKALNDPKAGLSALSRVGITFTEQQKEQIKTMQDVGDIAGAQNIILTELESQFGGSARAAADMSIQMKNAVGDIGEGIGKTLKPLWDAFTGAFLNFVNSGAIDAFTKNLQSGVEFIIANLVNLKTGWLSTKAALLTGFNTISTNVKIFAVSIEEIIKRPFQFKTYRKIFTALVDQIANLAKKTIELSKNLIKKGIGAIKDFRKSLFKEEEKEQKTFEEKIAEIKTDSAEKQKVIEAQLKADIKQLNDEELENKKSSDQLKLEQIKITAEKEIEIAESTADKKNKIDEQSIIDQQKRDARKRAALESIGEDFKQNIIQQFKEGELKAISLDDALKVTFDNLKARLLDEVIQSGINTLLDFVVGDNKKKEDKKTGWGGEIGKGTADVVGTFVEEIPVVGKAVAKAGEWLGNLLGFDSGGIVGGSNFQGDKVPVRVNSGEMILNRQQQKRLFSLATGHLSGSNQIVNNQGSSGSNINMKPVIDKLNRIEQAIVAPKMINLNGDSFTRAVIKTEKKLLRTGQLNTKG